MYCRYASLVAVLSVPLACSIVLKTTENQCTTDADCARHGGAMTGTVCREQVCVANEIGSAGSGNLGASDAGSDNTAWGCLGKVVWATPSKPQVNVTMAFVDLVAKQPVTNLTIHPCARMDVTCANPLSAAVSPDERGVATLTIPAGFDGYAEVLGTTTDADSGVSNVVPLNVFFNPPPVDDYHFGTVPTFTRQGLAALASVHQNVVDPTLGFLFSGALDCRGKPAAGVSWEPDRSSEATRRFYYVDGLPSEAAVSTDATGYGGFINM
ncbi:MAG TPA: hypothetical protein VIV60_24005, partial [Polyangiaceae bacterium]